MCDVIQYCEQTDMRTWEVCRIVCKCVSVSHTGLSGNNCSQIGTQLRHCASERAVSCARPRRHFSPRSQSVRAPAPHRYATACFFGLTEHFSHSYFKLVLSGFKRRRGDKIERKREVFWGLATGRKRRVLRRSFGVFGVNA